MNYKDKSDIRSNLQNSVIDKVAKSDENKILSIEGIKQIKWYQLKSIDKLSSYIRKTINRSRINSDLIENNSSIENILLKVSGRNEINNEYQNYLGNKSNELEKKTTLKINKNNSFLIEQLRIYDENSKNNKILGMLMIITIWSRYLDIIVKVKFGGFIFFSSFIYTFYSFNKYYTRYIIYKELEQIGNIMNLKTVSEVIDTIIKEDLINNKFENFSKNELSKYWNEPMAWH